MGSQAHAYPTGNYPVFEDDSGVSWTPLYWRDCSFSPEVFGKVTMNLIRNPNINSNHLFRADILLQAPFSADLTHDSSVPFRIAKINGFDLTTIIVRRLIPRNALVDKPLDQTCLLYSRTDEKEITSLVVYLPHISSPSESPFYHPAVRGVAFLHTFRSQSQDGVVSIHYSFFASGPQTPFLDRTAQHLLATLHKHGQGVASGYVKRVHHDAILPQAAVQDTYARLKAKYARVLIAAWVEVTDPTKHVFEDLGIAAFLIVLWAEMYSEDDKFPGFVDIGCGNGILVHILIEEGYPGWGFDARRRRSWDTVSLKTKDSLKELVLIPDLISAENEIKGSVTTAEKLGDQRPGLGRHPGVFPKGTFIISNHADELTPWTPILASHSESPFVMIPCCSHNLTGCRFRAPPPKDAGASSSSYASLIVWVTKLAEDCGWEVEKEMLRIPSTRNTALLGRRKKVDSAGINLLEVVDKYGGAVGWEDNAMKLVNCGPRTH